MQSRKLSNSGHGGPESNLVGLFAIKRFQYPLPPPEASRRGGICVATYDVKLCLENALMNYS